MGPQRIQLLVYVNLDPVPGAMHTPEDARNRIENILTTQLPHYKPGVAIKATNVIRKKAANE